jgi:hypothetical protein
MISIDDYLVFVDEALDGMAEIVAGLADELANRRPELPGANSPYAILTHCLGVMEFWAGHLVAGRDVNRDRDAEFVASGPTAELLARVRQVRRQFGEDVAGAEPFAPLRRALPQGWDDVGPAGRSQGGALIHVYEELAQHRGQMEGARDILRFGGPG